MSARDLLFQENSDLFKQNNESNIRASTKSTVVRKARVMSFEGIIEARKKREEKDAAAAGRRGRKRKNSASTPAHSRGQKSRAEEIEEANCEINAPEMWEGLILVAGRHILYLTTFFVRAFRQASIHRSCDCMMLRSKCCPETISSLPMFVSLD
jgi:hypothetical protein